MPNYFAITGHIGRFAEFTISEKTIKKLEKKAAAMCKERGEPIKQVNTYPEHILDELFQNEYDF